MSHAAILGLLLAVANTPTTGARKAVPAPVRREKRPMLSADDVRAIERAAARRARRNVKRKANGGMDPLT